MINSNVFISLRSKLLRMSGSEFKFTSPFLGSLKSRYSRFSFKNILSEVFSRVFYGNSVKHSFRTYLYLILVEQYCALA